MQMHLRTSWGAFGFLGCISFIRLHSGCSADAGDAPFLFLSLLYRMLAASEQSGSRNIAAPGAKLKVNPFPLAPAAAIPQYRATPITVTKDKTVCKITVISQPKHEATVFCLLYKDVAICLTAAKQSLS